MPQTAHAARAGARAAEDRASITPTNRDRERPQAPDYPPIESGEFRPLPAWLRAGFVTIGD